MIKGIIKLPFKIVALPFRVIRLRTVIYLTGLYTVGYGLYDMSYAAFVHNYREKINLRERYGPETWAIISGASDPIGKEFTEQLAKKGFNLVLID
jgi:hypothetical protein